MKRRTLRTLDALQADAGSYKKFFDPETVDEYRYSPGAFKGDLNRDCPIIRKTLMSKHPELLEWRKRYNSTQSALLGFYLLSGCDPFGLSSNSSEFIMYDPGELLPDGTISGAHNYWYPYDLFTLYSLRLFRALKTDLAELAVSLDEHFRFVYTTALLLEICQLETEKIRTFLARDVIKSREDF
jgi:hypothetical protein